jgi:hypothetical protein
MGYTLTQINTILSKADRAIHILGSVAYNKKFAELDETYWYDRDIIFLYKYAAEWGKVNDRVGTARMDSVVERLEAMMEIYDYGSLTPIYSQVAQVTGINTVNFLTEETDPTVPAWVKLITESDIDNWDESYTDRINSLTTIGSSGTATLVSNVLNIPAYTLSGLGGVPTSRQLTINGTTFDLSANRSWSVGTHTGNLTSGYIPKATGATTLTDGLLYDTGSAVLLGTQTAGSAKFMVYSATADNHYQAIGTAPSFRFADTIVSPTYTGIIGLATATNNFIIGAAAGDMVLANNTTSSVGNFLFGTGATERMRITPTGNVSINNTNNTYRLDVNGTGRFTGQLRLESTITNGTYTYTLPGATGTLALTSQLTSGTVTSVAASITGNSIGITGSPITSSGTLAFAFAGNATQYVRGDGALATLPTSGGGGGASVSYYLNGSINQGTIGGVTYYEMNKTPIIGAGTDFSRSSNGYIASFLTDANDPALLNIPAGNWNFETYFQASSGGGSPTFYIELYKYDGTTFTLIASNSGSPKLINDGTNIEAYFSALAVPQTTLTLTDRLAIRIYVTTAGRTITMHTENGHLCQVITTFTTGLTALNGLTAQVQYFATGTSGTDFNISSATATHTFNLPTASATNRGALSSADWTTFNNKQNALTNPITGTGTSGQVAYFNGTSSLTSSATFAFTPTSQLLVNNSVTAASAIAIGTNLTPTLTAAANNDVLVGLDINPTFTNGAFTGVRNYGLLVRNGRVGFGTSTPLYNLDIRGSGSGPANPISVNIQNSNSGGESYIGIRNDLNYYAAFEVFGSTWADNTLLRNTALLSSGSGITNLAFITLSTANISFRTNSTGTTNERLTIFGSSGNVGINQTTDAGFRLDVNGTARVQDNLTISKNQNGITRTDIINTTAGNSAYTEYRLSPSVSSGTASFGKYSTSTTAFKMISANDSYIYNGALGDINILNDNASGIIKFAAGASSTAQMTLGSTGNLTLNTNQNASTSLEVINTTSGTGALARLVVTSTLGSLTFGKFSTATTVYKNVSGNDGYIYLNGTGNISILNDYGTGNINFAAGGSSTAQLTLSSGGDLALGTTTFGTATKFTLGGSETASSAIARGGLINTTLVAAANNDVLVGLDINPTFTNGAFTGVSNVGLRTQSILVGTSIITGVTDAIQVKLSNATVSLQNTTATNYAGVNMYDDSNTLTGSFAIGGTAASVPSLAGNFLFGARKSTGKTIIVGGVSATQLATMFSTGNFLIQNAGTHTDAGFRLDVNGTARIQGNTNIIGNLSFNSSTSQFIINTGASGNVGRPSIWNQGVYSTLGLLGSSQGIIQDIFLFGFAYTADGLGGQRSWFSDNASIVNINMGWGNKSGGTGNNASTLLISNTINFTTTNTYTLRGIYYNPTVTALNGANHIAIQTVSGDVLLGTTSGNVAIGTSTLATATELTLGGSQTASSAIARGGLINTTLVASANNDVLVGLDINPTFTNGAFTGVTNLAARIIQVTGATGNNTLRLANNSGNANVIQFWSTNTASQQSYIISTNSTFGYGTYVGNQLNLGGGTGGVALRTNNSAPIRFYATNSDADFSTVQMQMFGATGNVLLQNGGTFTDAGFRLDVNGTARVQSFTTINAAPAVNGESALLVQPTTNNSTSSALVFGIYNNATINTITSTSSYTGIYSRNSVGATLVQAVAVQGDVNISAGTTSTALGFTCNSAVLGTGTASTFVGYNFTDVFKAGSGAVGRQIGIRIMNLTAGSTANVGLLFNNALNTSVSGTWDIYSQSGNNSYLAGSIGIGASTINASAKVQIDSTTQGFLPPRQNQTQRTAISSPAEGLIVYQTDGVAGLYVYSGGSWKSLTMTTI